MNLCSSQSRSTVSSANSHSCGSKWFIRPCFPTPILVLLGTASQIVSLHQAWQLNQQQCFFICHVWLQVGPQHITLPDGLWQVKMDFGQVVIRCFSLNHIQSGLKTRNFGSWASDKLLICGALHVLLSTCLGGPVSWTQETPHGSCHHRPETQNSSQLGWSDGPCRMPIWVQGIATDFHLRLIPWIEDLKQNKI